MPDYEGQISAKRYSWFTEMHQKIWVQVPTLILAVGPLESQLILLNLKSNLYQKNSILHTLPILQGCKESIL